MERIKRITPIEKPAGKERNLCGEFEYGFYGGVINFERLAEDLAGNFTNPYFNFDWESYISSLEAKVQPSSAVTVPGYQPIIVDAPFVYKLDGEERRASYNAKINKRICSLSPEWSYLIKIDVNWKEIEFKLSLYYANTEQYRKEATETARFDDFHINDKYRFLKLRTSNADDYIAFIEKFDKSQSLKIQNAIAYHFQKAFNRATTPKVTKWLYDYVPMFVLRKRDSLELWNDLIKLLRFDEKWFIDSNNGMIKAIRAIIATEKGEKFLYDQFEANPQIIKDIYSALDQSSKSAEFEGQETPNKTIFASLLMSLSSKMGMDYISKKKHLKTDIQFTISSNKKVDSNVRQKNDVNENLYDLTQKQELSHYEPSIYMDQYPVEIKEYKAIEATQHLHPLDVVTLNLEIVKGLLIPINVPAIFVKDQAHTQEVAEIMVNVRIGINVFMLIVGVATWGASTPLWKLLAIIDIGLAVGDLGLMTFEDKIRRIKGKNGENWGEQFLETWEKIYVIGGMASAIVAAPFLVSSLIQGGIRVLALVVGKSRDFVMAILFSAQVHIRIANFTGKTIKSMDAGVAVFRNAEVFMSMSSLTRLEQAGVGFIRFLDENEKVVGYSVWYKNTEIASGSAKDVRSKLEPVWLNYGKKLSDALDNMVALIPKLDETGKFWKATNKAGTQLRWGVQSIKNVDEAIESAAKSINVSKQWEGEVAKAFKKIDKVKQIGTKVERLKKGKFEHGGDFDLLTSKYLVECKESLGRGVLNSDNFEEQILKYIDTLNPDYINIGDKNVVVVIKKFGEGASLNHNTFKKLLVTAKKNNIKLEFITNINQIKNLK